MAKNKKKKFKPRSILVLQMILNCKGSKFKDKKDKRKNNKKEKYGSEE
jgi:hypothetical protein